MKEQEEERQAKEQERKELAQKQFRDDWRQETSDYISKCMDGLMDAFPFVCMVHINYIKKKKKTEGRKLGLMLLSHSVLNRIYYVVC